MKKFRKVKIGAGDVAFFVMKPTRKDRTVRRRIRKVLRRKARLYVNRPGHTSRWEDWCVTGAGIRNRSLSQDGILSGGILRNATHLHPDPLTGCPPAPDPVLLVFAHRLFEA